MNVLIAVLANVAKWVLEKGGAALLKWFKKKERHKEIEVEKDSDASAQRVIIDQLDQLDSQILVMTKNGEPIPEQITKKIQELEDGLREVSRKINSNLLD